MNRIPMMTALCCAVWLAGCSGGASDKAASHPDSLPGNEVYANPVDGKAYKSDNWKRYQPEGGAPVQKGPTIMKQVVLLTEQGKIPQLIDMDTLAGYIQYSEQVTLRELAGAKGSGEMLVQYTLYAKRKPLIDVSYNGSLDEAELSRLSGKLLADGRGCFTMKDSCVYQLHYEVNRTGK